MVRALNTCSGWLLLAYIALQWHAMLDKSKGAAGMEYPLEIIALLIMTGLMSQAFRPVLAVSLLVLLVMESLMFGSGGDLTALFAAPTTLLAICVMLANYKWAAVATFVVILAVIGTGVPTYYGRDAQTPIAVMFLPVYQLVPIFFVTLFVLWTWIGARERENGESPVI